MPVFGGEPGGVMDMAPVEVRATVGRSAESEHI